MTADQFTQHYIAAVFFTETGDTDQPDSDAELTPLFKARCWVDCRNFLEAYRQKLQECDASLEQAAHDLWFTRNGHGVGFWDRPEIYGQELADELTRVAKAMGSVDAEFEEAEKEKTA